MLKIFYLASFAQIMMTVFKLIIAESPLVRSRRESGAPYLRENGKVSIRKNLVRPYGLSG